jgi:hypothetical protein
MIYYDTYSSPVATYFVIHVYVTAEKYGMVFYLCSFDKERRFCELIPNINRRLLVSGT